LPKIVTSPLTSACLTFVTPARIGLGKAPKPKLLPNFHARISGGIPNGSRQGSSILGRRPVPLSGFAYDPDTLAMLYRALDEAFHEAVPDPITLDEASRQSIRQELARVLIQAYENGERDPELLAIIAVQSYGRH
jgi:hypothetical protein